MPQRYCKKSVKGLPLRTPVYLATLFIAALLLTGCEPGEGIFCRAKPDVNKAEIGMGAAKVFNTLGEPTRVIRGRGLYTNWEEWVYENGSLFLYRLSVKYILKRDPDTPAPEEYSDTRWDFKDPSNEDVTLMEIDKLLDKEKQEKREQKK